MYRLRTSSEEKARVETFINSLDNMEDPAKEVTLTFKREIITDKPECIVMWDVTAHQQARVLVAQCDKEVGFNMVVRRVEDEPGKRLVLNVEKLLVYPQKVTGATVDTDEAEQLPWLDSLSDDECNNMHGQGHSHVNMGVTPSATDEALYKTYVRMTPKDSFCYFTILNKKGERYDRIYDLKNGICYENQDIMTILNIDGWADIIEWAKKEKADKIKVETYTYYDTKTGKSQYGGTYPGSYSYSARGYYDANGKWHSYLDDDDDDDKKSAKEKKTTPRTGDLILYEDCVKTDKQYEPGVFNIRQASAKDKAKFETPHLTWVKPVGMYYFHAFEVMPDGTYRHVWSSRITTLAELQAGSFAISK